MAQLSLIRRVTAATTTSGGYAQDFTNATIVNVTHNLQTLIHSTAVVDTSGEIILGEVTYGLATDVIEFNESQSGTAYVVAGGGTGESVDLTSYATIVYVDGEIVAVSGTLTAEIDSDIAALSGTLSQEIDDDILVVSGTLSSEIDSDITTHTSNASAHHTRYSKDENAALMGADGITIVSGSNTITISGTYGEFVTASGTFQTGYDSLDGRVTTIEGESYVDSLNSLTGALNITGAGGNTINVGGSNIEVGGFYTEFSNASGTLQTDVDTRVIRAGDTMTGDLYVDGANVSVTGTVFASEGVIDSTGKLTSNELYVQEQTTTNTLLVKNNETNSRDGAVGLYRSHDNQYRSPRLNFYRTKGTDDSPTAVTDATPAGQIISYVWDGWTYRGVAGIGMFAENDAAFNEVGGLIRFATRMTTSGGPGGTRTHMMIRSDGRVGIGDGSSSIPGGATLSVDGTVSGTDAFFGDLTTSGSLAVSGTAGFMNRIAVGNIPTGAAPESVLIDATRKGEATLWITDLNTTPTTQLSLQVNNGVTYLHCQNDEHLFHLTHGTIADEGRRFTTDTNGWSLRDSTGEPLLQTYSPDQLQASGILNAVSGTFSDSLTVSGTPVALTPSVFYAYNTVEQRLTLNVPYEVDLDTVPKLASIYSMPASGTVELAEAGTYEVSYHVTVTGVTGDLRSHVVNRVELDSGGGFAEIPGTCSLGYVRVNGPEHGTTGGTSFCEDFDSGDQIRLITEHNYTNNDQIVDIAYCGSSMYIKRL